MRGTLSTAVGPGDGAVRHRPGPGRRGPPPEIDGRRVEGTFRAHQVPIASPRTNPAHLAALERWLRSYRPEELFDSEGRPAADLASMCPPRERRIAMNPASFGGERRVPLELPPLDRHTLEVQKRGAEKVSHMKSLSAYLADVIRANEPRRNFSIVCPDELESNRLGGVLEVTNRQYVWPLPEGTEPRRSTRTDPQVVLAASGDNAAALEGLAGLAPLHNPPALAAISRARELLPRATHVAVFDTAFFAELPLRACVYPLPYEWHTDWGIRRFGFHGISHAYCAAQARELLGEGRNLRLVVCHLGQGCSATAVRGGKAEATTMGFTPMEGLMMGSRSGSVDPGILLHSLRRGVGVEELDAALNRHSGLIGVSGVSSDYRKVEAAAREGNERARLALDIYAGRVREAVGALAATLGGLDAIVFTAGVGENSASLRTSVCERLRFLGLNLDRALNDSCEADSDVAAADSPGRILVIRTRENLMIAREARRVVLSSAP